MFSWPTNGHPEEVEQALASITEEHVTPMFKNYGITVKYWLQPITDIHLKSNFSQEGGDAYEYIYIFLAIAVFVILIACINYINLATARATRRAKEIGIRKTIGSTKGHIIVQFVAESTLLAMISLLFSIVLTVVLLPYFNELAAKSISTGFLFQPAIVGYYITLSLLIGLIGGQLPCILPFAFQSCPRVERKYFARSRQRPVAENPGVCSIRYLHRHVNLYVGGLRPTSIHARQRSRLRP